MADKKRKSSGSPMDTFAKHQAAIARKTLNMPDAMLGVMGGMTKNQAKDILRRKK